MSNQKNQHFVPKLLLKNFRDSDKLFYFYDKDKPIDGVKHRNPESVFKRRHLYTLRKHSQHLLNRSFAVENYFGRIETVVEPVITKIIDSVTKHQLPYLTIDERAIWDQFVCIQWKRTPDFMKWVHPLINWDKRYDDAIVEAAKKIALTPTDELSIKTPAFKEKILDDSKILAIAKSDGLLLESLSDLRMDYILTSSDESNFIIGSNPVLKLGSGEQKTLGDPNVQVWIPLGNRVAVCMTALMNLDDIHVLGKGKVRKLNRIMAKSSTQIAGCSKALIESLI